MAATKRPKFSLTEVSQEINLAELLGRLPTDTEKEAFISEAINLIIERTQSGVDRNGKTFKPYSKDYANFKGVSTSDVDLTLMGDMLSAVDGTSEGDNVVLLINDTTETLKAYNHNVGDTLPKRAFFGITQDEAELIAAKIEEAPNSELTRFVEEQNNFDIESILQNIGFQIG